MTRLDAVRASIPFLIAAGVAVLSTLGFAGESSGTGQSASIAGGSAGHRGDAWPADFDLNQVVNIVDLNKMLPSPLGSWGATPGDPAYTVRRDINPDGVINIIDLNMLLPAPLGSWGESCT